MGKNSSPQNLFTNSRSQFITRNNTRVIVQKGGLAILPCVVKLNAAATVSTIYIHINFLIICKINFKIFKSRLCPGDGQVAVF